MTKADLREKICSFGATDVGFFEDNDSGMPFYNGITIVLRLSDAIINQIVNGPTATYFNHYRNINVMIDQILLKTGLYLQSLGYDYITVAASQSMPGGGFNGCYSHKKGAYLSGLGSIGRNDLFLHKDFGPRVRLGTIFTNHKPDDYKKVDILSSDCGTCEACVKICPAKCITGNDWSQGCSREYMIDPKACNDYMRNAFMSVGRGSVCGLCISVCPKGKYSQKA